MVLTTYMGYKIILWVGEMVSRQAHYLQTTGSIPVPASKARLLLGPSLSKIGELMNNIDYFLLAARNVILFIGLFIVLQAIVHTIAWFLSGGIMNPLEYCLVGRIIYLIFTIAVIKAATETVANVN